MLQKRPHLEEKSCSDELSINVVIAGMVGAMILFSFGSPMTEGITITQVLISSVVGTIWFGLAGLIVAQATGMTDISMSGMALISVTLMMFLLNNNVAVAMVVGIVVCVAIGQGADMMQDSKTGFMIGARRSNSTCPLSHLDRCCCYCYDLCPMVKREGGQGGFEKVLLFQHHKPVP